MPLNQAQETINELPSRAALSNKTRPLTILMVDDNADEIFLTQYQVKGQGILNRFVSERCAENLFNTLDELNIGESPSKIVILLDVNMPRMDGFETLKAIRNHDQFKALPVIMFSSSDDEGEMNHAIRLGADGYLVKPFSVDSFISALGNVPDIKYQIFPAPLGVTPAVIYHLTQ
jgi:CheY-like chemotaxis protein